MLLSSGTPILTGLDLADRTPMRMPSYYSNSGVSLTAHFAAYAELYKTQPWVYTLVRKLSVSMSRLPLKVYTRVSDTERSTARDSPYGQLIRKPSPLGAKFLWNWVASTEELYGEAILVKVRDDNGRVRELLPVHPANIVIRRRPADDPNAPGELEYAYMAGARLAEPALISFPPSEVVHFRGYNPDNTARGLSPCEPLRQTLLSEDAMRRASSALWRNGARPSVSLSTDRTLSPDAMDRLKAQWDAAHAGVDSWGKTAILEEGLVPHVIQLNAEEMQYIQGRQLNREECCAVWDVPPPAVQILDRATFSNITEQMRSLYRETMAPRLESREDVLATQLAPDFSPSGDTYAEFDLDAVLRGSFEARIAAKAQAIGTGQITPAESRAEENLPFVEGSDRLLVNAALIPMTAAAAVEPPTGTDVEVLPQRVRDAADLAVTKALSATDMRTLAGRLSRPADVSVIDPDAFTLGLDDPDTARGLLAAAVARGVDVPTLRRWVSASTDLLELP